MGFDFEKMVRAFESVTFAGLPNAAALDPPPPRLPHALPFLAAMSEVALLFDSLGSGFGFVRRDITTKVDTLRTHQLLTADLTDAVLAEHPAGGGPPKQPLSSPAFTTTLLRLMWATRFIDVLMHELAASFAADSASESGASESDDDRRASAGRSRTLREAVARAYEIALAKHHAWAVRRTVSAAVYLLPSKEAFVQKLGVDISRRDEYLARISASLSPLVDSMYSFYDLHGLHD